MKTAPKLRCRRPFTPWECDACGARFADRAPPKTSHGLVCADCIEAGEPQGADFIPLTIRPRKPAPPDERPIVVVLIERDLCLTEAGETFDLAELVRRLQERPQGRPAADAIEQIPPAIIVTDNARDLLGYLEQTELAESPFWQWRVAERPREKWRPDRPAAPGTSSKRLAQVVDEVPCYFGWASRNSAGEQHGTRRSRYYQLLEPHHFHKLAGQHVDSGDPVAMLRFADELRRFCCEQGIKTPSMATAISAAMLRDPRFFPEWRRKVPEATNRRVRAHVPGNFYELRAKTDKTIELAYKMDLRSAHHNAALRVRFPDPDTLRARWYFRGTLPEDGESSEEHGRRFVPRRQMGDILEHYGLFCLSINVRRKVAEGAWELPCLRAPGRTWRYVWSGLELERILELERAGHVRIEGMIAAWTSPDCCEGLNEYALWALDALERWRDAGAWLKPALLATYGLLAAGPRHHSSAFKWGKSKQEHMIYTHEGELYGVLTETRHPRAALTGNAVARGLIEAHTRARVLAEARELEAGGFQPIAVYADAIFLLRQPPASSSLEFRYEGERHSLTFYDSTHYASREEQKLPGHARSMKEDAHARLQRFLAARSNSQTGRSGQPASNVGRRSSLASVFRGETEPPHVA